MKFHEIPIEFTTFHIVSFWSVLHCPKGESIRSIIIYFFAIKFSPQPLWKRNRTSSNLWLKSFPKVKLEVALEDRVPILQRSWSFTTRDLEGLQAGSRLVQRGSRDKKNKVVVYWTCRLRISRWILGGTSTSANRLVDVATGSVVLQPLKLCDSIQWRFIVAHSHQKSPGILHFHRNIDIRQPGCRLEPPPKKNKQTNRQTTNTQTHPAGDNLP